LIDLDVAGVPIDELPAVLGQLAQLQGAVMLRLGSQRPEQPVRADRLLTPEEAAEISGMSARWIRKNTRGLKFRRDLSRKNIRLAEDGFRAWLAMRRR